MGWLPGSESGSGAGEGPPRGCEWTRSMSYPSCRSRAVSGIDWLCARNGSSSAEDAARLDTIRTGRCTRAGLVSQVGSRRRRQGVGRWRKPSSAARPSSFPTQLDDWARLELVRPRLLLAAYTHASEPRRPFQPATTPNQPSPRRPVAETTGPRRFARSSSACAPSLPLSR